MFQFIFRNKFPFIFRKYLIKYLDFIAFQTVFQDHSTIPGTGENPSCFSFLVSFSSLIARVLLVSTISSYLGGGVSMVAQVQPGHILYLHKGQQYQMQFPTIFSFSVSRPHVALDEQTMKAEMLLGTGNIFRSWP